MVARDDAAEVKARVDIVDVIGGHVRLQRSGRSFKALCPFHSEKTPSFTVNQERQAWYCFGCQEGGDVFNFVEKIERVDFRQALELLAARAGIDLEAPPREGGRRGVSGRRVRILELHARAQQFYEHVLWMTPQGAEGRELLGRRALGEELLRQFGVGFSPRGGPSEDALARYLIRKAGASVDELVSSGLAHATGGGRARDRFRHRLIFPIRDERGRTIAFGARALGDAAPKYLNSPETAVFVKSRALFGLDIARPSMVRTGSAVIVEGYFDVIAAHRAGVSNTVASSGTALAREQLRVLRRFASSITLCFDADAAGEAAAARATELVSAEGLSARIVALPAGMKDPDEAVRADPEAFRRSVNEAAPEWQVLLDRAVGAAEGAGVDERRLAAERAVQLLSSIPQGATRDMYVQQCARRLEVTVESLLQDVGRAARHPGSRPRVSAPVPASPTRGNGAEPPAPVLSEKVPETQEQPLSQWEEYLGSLVLQRPSLARSLVDDYGLCLEDVRDARVRHFLQRALRCEGEEFPLHVLSPGEQALAGRLLVRSVPELDGDAELEALEQAMADTVRLVSEASRRAELAVVRRELRHAETEGRFEEAAQLAQRLSELAARAPRLRGTLDDSMT